MATMKEAIRVYITVWIVMVVNVLSDPDPLQDICVADLAAGTVNVNGYVCKESTKVTASDFIFGGIAEPGNTNNFEGSLVTFADVEELAGLNTLGVAMARVDFRPGGVNPPHTHPRATEIAFLTEGTLEIGFITTSNVLYTQIAKKGDVFVFPRGLVHYQKNIGHGNATFLAAFNSQLPGRQTIADALFAAVPKVPDDVLAISFQIGVDEVQKIKSQFASDDSDVSLRGVDNLIDCQTSTYLGK